MGRKGASKSIHVGTLRARYIQRTHSRQAIDPRPRARKLQDSERRDGTVSGCFSDTDNHEFSLDHLFVEEG